MQGFIHWLPRFTIIVIAASLYSPAANLAQDWPAFRGVDGMGSANPGGILAHAQNVDLKVRWKKQLGSGYSSVVVAGDRVITCYCDNENDKIICLDKKTGDTIWVSTLGPVFKGENGSFDGPITTPLVYDNLVYALDPGGRFCCFNLKDGAEVWVKDLAADFGSKKPLYGFATSPIVVADTLILQTGVEEKSIAGFDPQTGDIRWAVSNDAVNSQTPTAMKFLNRDIVLAAGEKKLIGVDPVQGEILFEFEHQGGNGSAVVPVPIADNGVVMTLDDMFSKAVSLRPGDGNKIEVSEKWQNRSIKNTYNVPALSDGHLFAFSTRILTCVDPETGDSLWKSREPGDGFLITIDGHMIINTKQGTLHVSRTSSEGYDEVAYLELFDDVCWSVPAYSDNAIFCRNLKEIACIDIVAGEVAAGMASADALPIGKRFNEFLGKVNALQDSNGRTKAVDEYLEKHDSFPIIEDGIVHFVYRGEGTDVAVASDIFGARQEKKMHRIDGTNLFYYTVRLEPDQRANYMFLVDYKPQVDPRNPRSSTSSVYAGEMEFAVRLRGEKPLEMSWFGMSEWKEPGYLANLPMGLSGSLTEETLDSEIIESGLAFDLYLPPGYEADKETRYRTVYVFAFPGGRELGELDKAADQIFASENSQVSPAILVFPKFLMSPQAEKAIIDELVPAIDKKYRTIADRDSRTTVGFGFAASNAFTVATKHSEKFCGAAVYSALILDLKQALDQAGMDDLEYPMEYYIDWGRYDMFNPHENWDIRDISKQLFEHCQDLEDVTVRGGMVNDSTDWSSWRNRYQGFLMLGDHKASDSK